MSSSFVFLDPGTLKDHNLEVVLVNKFPANPEKGYVPVYKFEMRDAEFGDKMGHISLRVGLNDNTKYGGNIGFGVEPDYQGNHYGARSIKLIVPFAKANGMAELWINCSPNNKAARKSCERVGAELVETVDLPETSELFKRGERQMCRYKISL